MLTALHDDGNQHHVAYVYPGPCLDQLRELGIPTYHITGIVHHYDPGAYYQLYKLVKKLRPNLLHTSLWLANMLGRLLSHHTGIPLIGDLHGDSRDEGTVRNFFDRWTAHIPYAHVAVSATVRDAYASNILEGAHQLILIKNGINPDLVRTQAYKQPLTRSDFGIPNNAFVVGAVGRLEPIKSYHILIWAFARLHEQANRPLILCIVGDGSQRKYLETLAHEQGIAHAVRFVGARSDAIRFYPLFDCFALSSQSEGLSIALLEALCFYLPVITTHAHHEHDVLTDGVHGILVEPNDHLAYTKALEALYIQPLLHTSMQSANQGLIREELHIQHTANAYSALYQAAINSSGRK